MDGLLELVPTMRTRIITTHSDPPFGIVKTDGTDRDGNEITYEVVGVPAVRDGKLATLEFFDVEDLDAAIARSKELNDATE